MYAYFLTRVVMFASSQPNQSLVRGVYSDSVWNLFPIFSKRALIFSSATNPLLYLYADDVTDTVEPRHGGAVKPQR